MATVSKEIADAIIAGKYPEDGAIKIVRYINMAGATAYGVVFKEDDPYKYRESPFVQNPTLYWQHPDYVPPEDKPVSENALRVVVYQPPHGQKEIIHVTKVYPDDLKWFKEHNAKISMEDLGNMIAVYADLGWVDEEGQTDEMMTVSAGRSCEDTLAELRKICEIRLIRKKTDEPGTT